MNPTGLLKTGITGTSPETVSSLNTKIYVPDPCPSSRRSQHQPMTQWKASRRPRNRTWTTSNFVLCWLHHCTCRSEKQLQNDRNFITLNVKNLMSSSSQDAISTGKPIALSTSQNSINKTFSDSEDFPLGHQQVFRSNEHFISFSNRANAAKSLLNGNRDHLLAEARSELMKQEHKVESLNTCISELQQQTYAQRLELEDAHFGYAESRREQIRRQEEKVMQEKAVRDSRITKWEN